MSVWRLEFIGELSDRFLSRAANHRRAFEYGGMVVILAPFGAFLWYGMTSLSLLWILLVTLFFLFGVLHSWRGTIRDWENSLHREMISDRTLITLLEELRQYDEERAVEIVRQHMAMLTLSSQREDEL